MGQIPRSHWRIAKQIETVVIDHYWKLFPLSLGNITLRLWRRAIFPNIGETISNSDLNTSHYLYNYYFTERCTVTGVRAGDNSWKCKNLVDLATGCYETSKFMCVVEGNFQNIYPLCLFLDECMGSTLKINCILCPDEVGKYEKNIKMRTDLSHCISYTQWLPMYTCLNFWCHTIWMVRNIS